ncbi:MAG TPA: type II toxin-antitoxin system VapC family toxin [Actinokineospora sp.]|jgi:predicted nucleic acid-binding protein|nr:type II toxin-antitoxin system VapC family toxin [Actinokineospora sp.]
MTLLYADTSVVVRAYLPDEPDHAELANLLFDSANPVLTSELTRVEFASAIIAAGRSGRLSCPEAYLDRFDDDCEDDGPFTLVELDSAVILPIARTTVCQYRLRTLDAIHLAVLATDCVAFAGGEPVALVTRDHDQADVARKLGIAVLT